MGTFRSWMMVGAWALSAGYLPVCGPAPLRWQPVSKPVREVRALPPLPSPTPIAQPPMPAPVETPQQTVEAGGQTNVPLVTAEMWLELFRLRSSEATNAPTTGVVIPFGFVPPAPAPQPGSRARFEVE
ncbi:MAG: hypothetical protein RMM51_05420 [Verrucomicrobiae bacterium]|nr:hypothetical protein [Verrucomicrobiae bacterium]